MKTLTISLRLLTVLTVLTGLLYPLGVWLVGHAFFPDAAEGSRLHRDGQLVGSALLAQKTTDPRYVWPRPSAGDYATVASGASNLAWTSAKLAATVAERRTALGPGTAGPADLVTASGSGLDPDLSPAAVLVQLPRIGRARQLSAGQQHALAELVAKSTETGHLGPARVNVLRLNLALDTFSPSP